MNFTIDYMNPLGTYDQKFGQKYWGKVKEDDKDVSFNMMNPVNFSDGDAIEFEEKLVKETSPQSKNPGKEYYQLKKVRLISGTQADAVPTPSSQSFKAPQAAADKAYLRDASTIPLDVWRTLVGIQGVPETPEQFSTFFETVREHTEELLAMIDNVRNNTKPQKSLKDSWDKITEEQ